MENEIHEPVQQTELELLQKELDTVYSMLAKKTEENQRLKKSTANALKKAKGRMDVTIELRRTRNENRELIDELARLRGFEYQ